MSFLAPVAFAAMALAIPILLLYMLRLRRREVLISSTFLWRQVVQDTEANTPWQRLRRNLLLFLQLLILLLLVLALARPFVTVPTISAGKIALLVDASASMTADDVAGETRFAAALEQAHQMVNNMNPQDIISLVRVADIAEPLTSYTADKSELRRAPRKHDRQLWLRGLGYGVDPGRCRRIRRRELQHCHDLRWRRR